MPRPEDVEASKQVRKEIARRPLDTSLMNVRVSHGVVYLTGTVKSMRGHNVDAKQEMDMFARVLRQRPGIRDVVLDLTFRG
ncbi:MAG: hypothetical protein AKCLJLPJ_01097 [Fimbriimonadales bacterium]|nr:MAG: BON domain-containing protein [Armatimonadota bacterium]MBV6503034.1 hypothetical protein [Fimbriimonadales bacterium]MCE7899387.1 BON domain-containing protein [Armatimonadetes bacterium ATM1]MDL1927962.1 BON domain-containing protein [Fimbriimonadia bacterium ATM]MBC6969274.1 BON domain-containing protein [Armatimonadota bacterium]